MTSTHLVHNLTWLKWRPDCAPLLSCRSRFSSLPEACFFPRLERFREMGYRRSLHSDVCFTTSLFAASSRPRSCCSAPQLFCAPFPFTSRVLCRLAPLEYYTTRLGRCTSDGPQRKFAGIIDRYGAEDMSSPRAGHVHSLSRLCDAFAELSDGDSSAVITCVRSAKCFVWRSVAPVLYTTHARVAVASSSAFASSKSPVVVRKSLVAKLE